MPLIYIHSPKAILKQSEKNAMVAELTTIALKIEGLPDTDFVRSTAWTYFQEYDAENCFKGGKLENANGVSIEVNVFKGGLDNDRKGQLIEAFTQIVTKYLSQKAPIYVLIRENETENWGVLGKRITLDALFNPLPNAEPI